MKKGKSVPVQKGPIDMSAQYTQKFHRQPEHTLEDLKHNAMRQDKMTMDLHTPRKS